MKTWTATVVTAALALALAGTARAASYTWTNAASGASGYWINGVNWGQASNTYPITTDSAYLTNSIASGAYTSIFDYAPGLGGPLAALVISNNSAGQARLIVTNATLGVNALTLGNGGNLQIDNGGIVSNTASFTWRGANGTLCLDNGGVLFSVVPAITFGAAGVTGTVTTLSAPGGTWNLLGQDLTIGNALNSDSLVVNGVTFTNAGIITIGYGGGTANNNALAVSNATIRGSALNVGYGGTGNMYNNLATVNNGTIAVSGRINFGSAQFPASTTASNSLVITNGGYVSAGDILNMDSVYSGGFSNSVKVLDGGTLATVGATFGYSGASYASVLINGGGKTSTWNVGGGTITVNGSESYASIAVDGSGVAGGAEVTNAGVSLGGPYGSLVLTNGARFFSINSFTIGSSANNNTFTLIGGSADSVLNGGGAGVTIGYFSRLNAINMGSGGVMTNVGAVIVGYGNSSSNRMVMSNAFLSANGNIHVGQNYMPFAGGGPALSNSMLIADGSIVNAGGGFFVGGNGYGNGARASYNSAIITNGSQVSTLADSYIGGYKSAGYTVAFISNSLAIGGSLNGTNAAWNLGGKNLYVGNVGNSGDVASSNSLTLHTGGILTNAGLVTVGNSAAAGAIASYNTMTVSNAGLWVSGQITVGSGVSAYGNSMIVTNSSISSLGLWVGSTSSNNTVTIQDAASLWNFGNGVITVGSAAGAGTATGNVFNFVASSALTNIGGVNLYDRNANWFLTNRCLSATFAGLNLGSPGCGGNSLTLSNQNFTSSGASIIGNGSTTNTLILLDDVTWNGGGKNLTVGNGAASTNTLIVSGGTLTNLGTLTASGTVNTVVFNSGLIRANAAVISNSLGTAFSVGDGTNRAHYDAVVGSHSYNSGLVIASNAWLTGNGAVVAVGNVIVTNGGCISPGADTNGIGTMTINTNLYGQNGAIYDVHINNVKGRMGFNWDMLKVNGTITNVTGSDNTNFVIRMDSLGQALAGFSPTAGYSLPIATYTPAIDTNNFTIDTNLFLDGGNWRVLADKGTLYLVQDGSKISGGTKCTWTNLASAYWSTAGAWDSAPAQGGGADTMLEFRGSGATSYTASNSWTGSFTNNTIVFNSGASVSNYLVGQPIVFVNGANPAGFYQYTNGPFVVSNSIVLATNIVFDGEGVGRVVMAGSITGTGGVSCIGGANETMLMASNTFAGPVVVNISGLLTLGHLWAIGTNSLTLSNGTVNATLAGASYIVGNGWTNQCIAILGNGSIWTNAAALVVGTNAAVSNIVTLANGGNLAATAVNIGNSPAAVGNGLVISNGGTVAGGPITVGSVATATGSYFTVFGGGVAICSNIIVGNAGSKFNTMMVSNATLSSSGLTIGNAANSNTGLVSGGTVSNFSGTVYIGYNGVSNNLSINNGGQWFGGNVYVGYGSSVNAYGNSYNVGDPGAASTVSNGAIYVGWATSGSGAANYNTMTVSNAILQMGGALTIAHAGNGVNNNWVIVDNQGTIQLGNNSIVILPAADYGFPAYGSNNGLVITNGGHVAAGALTVNNSGGTPGNVSVGNGGTLITAGATAINGWVTVTGGGGGGPTSTWNLAGNALTLASGVNYGTVTVDGNGVAGGAVVTNVGALNVGSLGGSYGTMVMTNGAQVVVTSVNLGVAVYPNASSYNKLTLMGGAGVASVLNAGGGAISVGYQPNRTASDGNQLTIGSGGILTNAGPIRVGWAASRTYNGIVGNQLVVTNGGQLFTTGNSFIGEDLGGGTGSGVANNGATVSGTNSATGAASLWNLGGKSLTVGYGVGALPTINSVLTVSAGGILTNAGLITIGSGASAKYSTMTVSNATVVSAGLTIGSSSYSNTVNVTSNSVWNLLGANLTVGSGGATANVLTVSSGNIVTNVGTLTVPANNTLSLGAGVQLGVNAATIAGALDIGIDETLSPTGACVAAANSLNISGATLNLTAGVTVDSPCVIARYGTLTGTFVATNGLPAGCWVNYAYGGNQIAVMPPIVIANLGASGVTAVSATFNASLQAPRTNADVTVYWGETDGTNNPGAWDHSASVGSWANVGSVNIGFTTNGLSMGTQYFYTFRAANGATNVWASPSTNFTVRNPETRYWDGGTTNIPGNGNGASDGGAGTWNTTTNNWDQGNGLAHVFWDNSFNDVAVFGGAPGIVTLGAGTWVGGLQFDVAGYTVWNNTLTFGTSSWINANADVTINSVMAGSVPVAKVGTGTLNNFGDNTLTGPFSVQTGTVFNTVNWVGNGRSGQQAQVGGYGAAVLWTNTIAMVVGSGAAGISNTFIVASQGVLRVSGGLGVGTNGAMFNSLVITNGGQVFSTAASYIGINAASNTVQVVGGGAVASLWNLGAQTLTVGSGGAGNVLRIDGAGVAGGAVVTNAGLSISGNGNSVLLTNGAQVVNNAGGVSLSGSSNTLTVVGGAASSLFYGSSNQFNIAQAGGNPGSTTAYNRVVIGAGGVMTNVGFYSGLPEIDFPVGWAQGSGGLAFSNQLVVTDGGQLYTIRNLAVGFVYGNASAGGVASSNSLLIANGGYLNAPGNLYVGSDSASVGSYCTNSFNSLTITNGGRLFTGADSYIGRAVRSGTVANNNTATLGGSLNGTNALWNLGGLNLFVGARTGGTATGNVLTVNAGGVVSNAASLTVTTTNTLELGAGGRIFAGAVTNLGTLNLVLDDAVSPACGRLAATGNLNVTNATLNIMTNGAPAGSVYVFASYGSLTGSFLATNGMPAGYLLLTNYNQIALVLPGTPFVGNAGATNAGAGTCTVQGLLTSGGVANAWICWGTNDGGSTATSAWNNVVSMGEAVQGIVFSTSVSGLSTNVTYWYRCFVSNAYGTAWASPATWFNAAPASGGSAGGGTVGSWTPSNLASVALWLDASTATINAGTVSVVNAGSGGGTISGPASLAAGAINSLQAVQFNGTSQYVTGNYTNTGTTLAAFFVGKSLNSSQTAWAGMMSVWANGQANDFDNAGSAVLFGQSNTLANSVYTHRNAFLSMKTGTLTNPFLADTIFNGSTDTLYLNGTPGSSVGSSGSFNAGKVQLGARWTASAFNTWWNGQFGEAIICNTNLSTTDRQKVEGYLAWKWGLQTNLPADHPFKLGPPSANGGVVTYTDSNGLNPTNTPYAGGYVVHTFYGGSDTFSNATATSADVLVVGGGGGGGSNGGGGGGGGGVIYSNALPLVAGSNYTVTVGAGGPAHPNDASNPRTGTNSVFGALTALGGGGGSSRDNGGQGTAGGSGGGGGGATASPRYLAGTNNAPGQGNNGGNGVWPDLGVNSTGGGGGGAGSPGTAGASQQGGNGGTGVYCAAFAPLAGSPPGWFGGGGAGGRVVNGNNGLGGTNGGGGNANVAGVANTGGGGGGGGSGGAGPQAGGSGIVIVRYPSGSSASIANLAPTAITNTAAVLNAQLQCPTTNCDVYVHWGFTDGTNNSGAWAASTKVGAWTNAASTNVCYTNTSLVPNTTYYYTFRMTNATTNVWASPSWRFSTPISSDTTVEGTMFKFR